MNVKSDFELAIDHISRDIAYNDTMIQTIKAELPKQLSEQVHRHKWALLQRLGIENQTLITLRRSLLRNQCNGWQHRTCLA